MLVGSLGQLREREERERARKERARERENECAIALFCTVHPTVRLCASPRIASSTIPSFDHPSRGASPVCDRYDRLNDGHGCFFSPSMASGTYCTSGQHLLAVYV